MAKMFKMIIETSDTVFKHYEMADTKKDALKIAEGNGEVLKIEDVTDKFPINLNLVFNALKDAGFGDIESNAIYTYLNRYENVK